MKKHFRVTRLAGALAVLLATAPVYAQNTAANLAGRITSADGAPLVGAEVTIVHTPSGTTSRATTDAQGRYTARNLRVGGPYTVTVQKDGFQGEASENVFLLLGETSAINVDLDPATTLEAVEVVAAQQSAIFTPDSMGAGTNVTREQIESFPSIGRNIQDYVRLDPRIAQTDKDRGEISAGGQNSRFNAIRIDGVSTNDPFGLESNNLPTLRQPVSIDAIEEINVSLSNYDAAIAGATGAVINAVTKSGTNEFDGSVYYVYRDDSWVGEDENGNDFTGFQDEETYGGVFGGPLIKDRLFFFLTYEKFTRSAPAPDFGPVGSGASNELSDISPEEVAEIQNIARTVYGFEPGTLEGPDSLKTEVEEYSAKFDWNINDSHRANFRYTNTEQVDAILPGFGTGSLSLSSYWYNQVKSNESYGMQLFSDWSDNFSSEFKLSYREYDAIAATFSDLPSIRVDLGRQDVLLGTEQFRHTNVLLTDTLNAFWAGNYYVGDHDIKFGLDYEENQIFNLFGRDLNGVYTFNSIENFRNGISSFYSYRRPTNGDDNSVAADWTLENLGVFVQDTWAVNYNLNLMFGIRVDTPIVDDKPFANATASTLFGYDNQTTIDGNELIQPRFGFNYTFDWDRPTQLRGGIGLFQGASANVWLSNPFSNNGLTVQIFQSNTGINTFSPDPDNQPTPATAPPAQAVDFVDPNLQQPSAWKANLAFDHELPWWGLVASAELLLTQVEEGIYYEHLNLGAPTRQGPDGRIMFWNPQGYNPANFNQNGQTSGGAQNTFLRNRGFTDVLLAKSTNKGRGEQLTLSLQKPMSDNWSWQLAYTYTDATEVNALTSSQSGSNWANHAIFQANEEVASRSNYVVRDRFTAAASYRHYFFEDLKTEVAMIYEGRKGKPFSYTFDNDANGDGRINDLLYIPAGRGDVQFGSAAEENAFWAYVAQDEYLLSHLGQVAERNASYASWTNNIDVRISQELPSFFEGHKAEIYFDILNFGNLINEDWGHIDEIGFPLTRGIVEYGGIDPNTGRYVYRFNTPDTEFRRDRTGESRWAVQATLRYQF